MREASSRDLMEALWDAGAKVQAYDPVAMEECQRIYGDHPALTLCEGKDEALHSADALAIVTEWNEFRSPNFDHIKNTLSQAVIFDGRNLYETQLNDATRSKIFCNWARRFTKKLNTNTATSGLCKIVPKRLFNKVNS